VSVQQIGKHRNVLFVVVVSLATLFIYQFVWYWKLFAEIRRWRGHGVSGFVGFVLSVFLVGHFLLPSYVGRMYRELGLRRPISGWTGFISLFPFIGWAMYLVLVQGKLNDFWAAQTQLGASAAGELGGTPSTT
jgi:hypothetical protein